MHLILMRNKLHFDGLHFIYWFIIYIYHRYVYASDNMFEVYYRANGWRYNQ